MASWFEDLLKGVMGATAVGAGINQLMTSPTTTVTANPPLAPSPLETTQMQLNMAQQIANLREAGYDVQFQPGGSVSLAERPLRPEEILSRATRGTAQGSVLTQLMRDEANPPALRDQLGSALTARRTASMTGRPGIDRVGLIRSIISRQGGGMPGLQGQGGTGIPGGNMGGLGGTTIPPLSSQPQGGRSTSTSGGGGSGLGTALNIASPLLGGGAAIAKHFGLFGNTNQIPADVAQGAHDATQPFTPGNPLTSIPSGNIGGNIFNIPGGIPDEGGSIADFLSALSNAGIGTGVGASTGINTMPFTLGGPSIPSIDLGALPGLGAGAGAEAGGGLIGMGGLGGAMIAAGIPLSFILGSLPFLGARKKAEIAKEKGFASSYFQQITNDPQAWANHLEEGYRNEGFGDAGKRMTEAALAGRINNSKDVVRAVVGEDTWRRIEDLGLVDELPIPLLSQWATQYIAAPGEPWHGSALIESNPQDIRAILEIVKSLSDERGIFSVEKFSQSVAQARAQRAYLGGTGDFEGVVSTLRKAGIEPSMDIAIGGQPSQPAKGQVWVDDENQVLVWNDNQERWERASSGLGSDE